MMSATEQLFALLEVIRELNVLDEHIVIVPRAMYKPTLYKEVAKRYKNMTGINLPYFDIFLLQLSLELDKNNYEKAKTALKEEIGRFLNWYNSNKVIIDENFSFDAIEDVIEEEVRYMFGLKMQIAKDEVTKAAKDEKIWHELARSYGSRAVGEKTHKNFNEDDWDYIRGSLEQYESHFNCKVDDFEKMYQDYCDNGRHLVEIAQDKVQKIHHEIDEYKRKIRSEYQVNAYRLFHDYLYPIFISFNTSTNEVAEIESDSIKPLTRRRGYGKYQSLEECIPDNRVVKEIDVWAEDYYSVHNEIDTVFGRQVFSFLLDNHLFCQERCARDHFGDLLLQRYKGKCSYKNGKSLEGDKSTDVELGRKIRDFILKLEEEH